MTDTNTQSNWLETHRRLTAEADIYRDSQSVAFGLIDAYDQLTSAEKLEIHEILAEWFVSEVNKLRYDAGFLTSQRKIVEMLPAIEEAIMWIGEPTSPESKHELEKLNRIRGELQACAAKRP